MKLPFQKPAMDEPKAANISNRLLLYLAYSNLVTKRLRTSLTVLGIVIGIGAIFFLFSLGLGIRGLVTNEIVGNTSIKAIDVTSPNSRVVKLDRDVIERMKKLANVTSVGASHSQPGAIVYQESEVDSVVYGVDDVYTKQLELPIPHGRDITPSDGKVAVINIAALNAMGIMDEATIVGKKLTVTIPQESAEPIKEEYEVIGVTDSGTGGEIYVPNFIFENAGIPTYAEAKVVVADTEDIPAVRGQIESLGLETSSPIDSLDQINQVFRFFNLVLLGLGSIGMIVAVLGMFNTLTISLLERTKEIGLMVASGFRSKDIRRLFVIESLILSVFGAATGILLAWIISGALNQTMNMVASRRGVDQTFNLFSQPLWLIVAMIVFMILVGLLVVYYPARRAEKINPIDALRRE